MLEHAEPIGEPGKPETRSQGRELERIARTAETSRRLADLASRHDPAGSESGQKAADAIQQLTARLDTTLDDAVASGSIQAAVGQNQSFGLRNNKDQAILQDVLKTFGAHLTRADLPRRQLGAEIDADVEQFHTYRDELPALTQDELPTHREGSYRVVDANGKTCLAVLRTDVPGVRLLLDGSAITEGKYDGQARFRLLVDTGLEFGHVEVAKKRLSETQSQLERTFKQIIREHYVNPLFSDQNGPIASLRDRVDGAIKWAVAEGHPIAHVVQHWDLNLQQPHDAAALTYLLDGLGVKISVADLPGLHSRLPTHSETEAQTITRGSFTVLSDQPNADGHKEVRELRLSTNVAGVSLALDGPGIAGQRERGLGTVRPMLVIDTSVHDPSKER